MLIEPGQLRLLALIERHGSLAAVARAMGSSPAAVTQQVARAERRLMAPLVVRSPRGATLTAVGSLLAAHGRVIDQESARASEHLVRLLGHLSLRLHIGAFQAASLHLLPPALTALRHRRPDADLSVVDVTSKRGPAEVTSGRLDMAVVATWGAPIAPRPHLAVHELLLDPLVVVLADDHPLVAGGRRTAIRLEDLRDEAWVTIRAGHAAREQFDRAAGEAGFVPKVRFQTESYDVAQALVGTGIGVALVSRLALARVAGTTHRALARPLLHRQIYAVTAADTGLTPLVPAFLHLLHEVSRDIRAGWGCEEGAGHGGTGGGADG